jgi:lipocalin
LLIGVGLVGCQSWTDTSCAEAKPPLRAIERTVDLKRFMGDWHGIAHTPTFIEDEALNGVESYLLDKDCTIARPTPNGACSSSGRSRPPT